MYLSSEKFSHEPTLEFNSCSFIYLLANKLNGKRYIGQTAKTVYYLFSRYRKEVKAYRGKAARYVARAIKKYGLANFHFSVLEYCPEDKLNDRERFYIENYHTRFPDGYNLSAGGENERGWKWSKQSREKLKKWIRDNRNFDGANNPFYGKTHSERTRQLVTESNRRRSGCVRVPLSQEARKRISDGIKNPAKGLDNNKSKCYKLRSPLGEEFEFCGGFKPFCSAHKIKSPQLLIEVLNGKRFSYKGWTGQWVSHQES